MSLEETILEIMTTADTGKRGIQEKGARKNYWDCRNLNWEVKMLDEDRQKPYFNNEEDIQIIREVVDYLISVGKLNRHIQYPNIFCLK